MTGTIQAYAVAAASALGGEWRAERGHDTGDAYLAGGDYRVHIRDNCGTVSVTGCYPATGYHYRDGEPSHPQRAVARSRGPQALAAAVRRLVIIYDPVLTRVLAWNKREAEHAAARELLVRRMAARIPAGQVVTEDHRARVQRHTTPLGEILAETSGGGQDATIRLRGIPAGVALRILDLWHAELAAVDADPSGRVP
jgi:hypothetical protein